MTERRLSKYQPLTEYLAAQPSTCLTLTFAQLADLLDSPLPRMAWTGRWWANAAPRGNNHAHAWLSVGWRVDRVEARYQQTVTFVRQDMVGKHDLCSCPSCRPVAAG